MALTDCTAVPATPRRRCRGLIRSHTDAFGVEDLDGPSQGTQSKMVRQRSNPEKPSELTSIRGLLQDVTQDAHEGSLLPNKRSCTGLMSHSHKLHLGFVVY